MHRAVAMPEDEAVAGGEPVAIHLQDAALQGCQQPRHGTNGRAGAMPLLIGALSYTTVQGRDRTKQQERWRDRPKAWEPQPHVWRCSTHASPALRAAAGGAANAAASRRRGAGRKREESGLLGPAGVGPAVQRLGPKNGAVPSCGRDPCQPSHVKKGAGVRASRPTENRAAHLPRRARCARQACTKTRTPRNGTYQECSDCLALRKRRVAGPRGGWRSAPALGLASGSSRRRRPKKGVRRDAREGRKAGGAAPYISLAMPARRPEGSAAAEPFTGAARGRMVPRACS